MDDERKEIEEEQRKKLLSLEKMVPEKRKTIFPKFIKKSKKKETEQSNFIKSRFTKKPNEPYVHLARTRELHEISSLPNDERIENIFPMCTCNSIKSSSLSSISTFHKLSPDGHDSRVIHTSIPSAYNERLVDGPQKHAHILQTPSDYCLSSESKRLPDHPNLSLNEKEEKPYVASLKKFSEEKKTLHTEPKFRSTDVLSTNETQDYETNPILPTEDTLHTRSPQSTFNTATPSQSRSISGNDQTNFCSFCNQQEISLCQFSNRNSFTSINPIIETDQTELSNSLKHSCTYDSSSISSGTSSIHSVAYNKPNAHSIQDHKPVTSLCNECRMLLYRLKESIQQRENAPHLTTADLCKPPIGNLPRKKVSHEEKRRSLTQKNVPIVYQQDFEQEHHHQKQKHYKRCNPPLYEEIVIEEVIEEIVTTTLFASTYV